MKKLYISYIDSSVAKWEDLQKSLNTIAMSHLVNKTSEEQFVDHIRDSRLYERERVREQKIK